MLPRDRSCIAAALVAIASIACARGQVVDFQDERQPVVEIHDLWRFHTGDDPDGKLGWADPGFDDSSWKLLRSDQPWSIQGFPGYSGIAWYRFKVILPPNQQHLALYIPEISTSYQVFADGRLSGQFGGLPPRENVVQSFGVGTTKLIPLPSDLTSRGGPLTIAIRVWQWPRWSVNLSPGGPYGAIRIGDAGLLDEWRNLWVSDEFRKDFAGNVLLCGYLLAGLAGLGLFLLRPSEREYLWFAAAELVNASTTAWGDYFDFKPIRWQGYWALFGCLITASSICFFMFLVALLKQRRTSIYWIALVSALVASLPTFAYTLNWIGDAAWLGTGALAGLPYQVCVLLLLFFAARRGNLDARLLLGPVALSYGGLIVNLVVTALSMAGTIGWETYFRLKQLFTWPFPVSARDITDFLMQISILAILVLRFARTRRDEERHAFELEAARAVQQVLIPADIPTISGFQIQSVYKPAEEVGGDFFQIIPLSDGGLLVVIGDVSGKGMPAAMTVSLLVGTLRTLAHYTQSPGEILAAMNQRMLARSRGGFTTCLVLRCDADGKLTIANAGHVAPYVAGKELPLENGMPLGLAASSTFAESCFQLARDQQVTLLTDGVVEARDQAGALLGFERSAALSTQPAEAIASAAQAFGQDDDITVLTLSYAGVPASA
jgi:sigma-B regulation protein RsbU (phosphoserine phosphatase)